MFNKISKSIILTLEVCCIVIMLLSCNNFLNPNKSTFIPETITTEKAYIEISTKFSRTVLPQSYDEFSSGLSWTLSVTKLGDTSVILTRTWNDDNATTAYQRMINTKDISLESGEYTFTLVASLNGLKVLESTLQKNLISGINTLSFSMKEATGDNVANGQVNFTLNWTVDNIISKVVSTFQEYNGNEISTETNDRISENSYNFTKTDVTPGLYLLKIELQQMDPITKINETINRYSCLVRVAPGLVSSGEATIQSLAPLYTINYILNEGALQSGITQVSYNSYTSFELPIPEKSGFNFVGWYTDENLTQKVENNKYTLTSDITLYAKWEKQRILDDGYVIGDQDDDKNVVDSTKASFDTSNGYGILTVNNPGESSSVWDYYIEQRDLFSEGKNYSVSVDLKTDDSDTVVGIAAANCDMFFTVGTEWQTYTFETGYLETATSNGITIGSALANKLYISDIVITPIDDDSLPTLSFNVTKAGIETYLYQTHKPEQIIEVSKKDTNSGYEITINTPISSDDSSQNVTLQLRDYAYVGNMNKASFNLTSTDAALKTSIKGFSVNQEEIDNNNNKIKSWNTPATFKENNTVFFPAFANEENGGDLVPCVIEGILSSGTSDSTTISISNFNIVEATTNVIQSAGKTYAINIGNSWYKSYGLPLSADSADDTTCQVLFRNDFDDSPNPDDWNECIRFLYNGQTDENFTLDANKKVTLNEDFTISVEDNPSGSGGGTGGVTGTTVESLTTSTFSSDGTFIATSTTGEIAISSTIEISTNVTLTSDSNVVIKRASSFTSGPMFKVNSTGSLTLSNITLDGGAIFSFTENDLVNKTVADCLTGQASTDGPFIINNGGIVNLNSGAVLQNNWFVYSGSITGGSAIYMESGTLNINGAIIQNNYCNTSYTYGGGTIFLLGGTCTFNSGEIKNNYSLKRGGGINIYPSKSNVTFIMNGGTIQNNAAGAFGGGLVVFDSGSTNFTTLGLISGTITNNYASASGGGLYFNGGNPQSTGYIGDGTTDGSFIISDNKVAYTGTTATGAGMFISCSAKDASRDYFEIKKGALIQGNLAIASSATIKGLGVYLSGGNVLMSGGKIINNIDTSTVAVYGGGLYTQCDKFTMTGGEISGNSLTSSGGVNGQQIYFTPGATGYSMIIGSQTYTSETKIDNATSL